MKEEFLEYVKERESKYLGSNIDKDDLITIEDANNYFNEFEQLRIGGVSQLLSEYENFKLIKQDLLQNRNEFINEFLKERNCG